MDLWFIIDYKVIISTPDIIKLILFLLTSIELHDNQIILVLKLTIFYQKVSSVYSQSQENTNNFEYVMFGSIFGEIHLMEFENKLLSWGLGGSRKI